MLTRANLGGYGTSVEVPLYDPATTRAGIVHLGFGGFHRAHMARYTHNLMQTSADALRWGIVGVALLPSDRPLHNALKAQDGLYTLVERSGEEESVAIIGAATRLIDGSDDPQTLLTTIQDPAIRIVSLTITENGYGLNPSSKRLDANHPVIANDLKHPDRPKSAVGVITEALHQRKRLGRPAFTALSCDNIQSNGRVLKQAVLEFARLTHPDLAEWIETHGRFPSTMVDRITPRTRPADVADLAERFGVSDRAPVFCERFSQWVIEDDFADGRPDWERAGAQVVRDVAPYERMKLRLLNASHLALAGLGRLAGHRFVHEALGQPLLRRYLTALMDHETGQTLRPVPGVDLTVYKTSLIERFRNSTLMDTLDRINADAPVNYLIDPLRDRLASRAPFDLLALALAAWLRRVGGRDDHGAPIEIIHPLAGLLQQKAAEGGADPRPLLSVEVLFGPLGRNEVVVSKVGRWLGSLYAIGAMETLEKAAQDRLI